MLLLFHFLHLLALFYEKYLKLGHFKWFCRSDSIQIQRTFLQKQLWNLQFFPSSNISGKKCWISSFSISTIANSRTPGVSITLPPKLQKCICAKVVVCFPFRCASDISPVFKSSVGSSVFTKVDFPLPEWPKNTETLSFKRFFKVFMFSPETEEIFRVS